MAWPSSIRVPWTKGQSDITLTLLIVLKMRREEDSCGTVPGIKFSTILTPDKVWCYFGRLITFIIGISLFSVGYQWVGRMSRMPHADWDVSRHCEEAVCIRW